VTLLHHGFGKPNAQRIGSLVSHVGFNFRSGLGCVFVRQREAAFMNLQRGLTRYFGHEQFQQ
jgi:hypothetical protein